MSPDFLSPDFSPPDFPDYVVKPDYLWGSIVHLAKSQDGKLLDTLQKGFKFIEEESFSSNFQGLFSEINLGSDKLGASITSATPSSARSSARSRGEWRFFDQ